MTLKMKTVPFRIVGRKKEIMFVENLQEKNHHETIPIRCWLLAEIKYSVIFAKQKEQHLLQQLPPNPTKTQNKKNALTEGHLIS